MRCGEWIRTTARSSSNGHLKGWCERNKIQLTRGRPYKKDDNAHIEQKNWTHVRKLLGWERYDRHEAVEAMNDLYQGELRLWLNLFLPSVKLVEKVRVGSKVRRVYDGPRTPFERVRACAEAHRPKVAELEACKKQLDPFQLAGTIERKRERIYRLANRRLSPREVKTAPLETQKRGNGCGKAVPEKRDLEIQNRFPLSHSPGDRGAPVTSQMSRQPLLRLHS